MTDFFNLLISREDGSMTQKVVHGPLHNAIFVAGKQIEGNAEIECVVVRNIDADFTPVVSLNVNLEAC